MPSNQPSTAASAARSGGAFGNSGETAMKAGPLSSYQIIRRNGSVVPFAPDKIAIAMMKAFLAVHGTQGAASASVRDVVDELTQAVVHALVRSRPGGGTFHIEDVHSNQRIRLPARRFRRCM